MKVLKNKETGELIDPRAEGFALSPADVGFDSWDDALASDRETDLIDGYAVVEFAGWASNENTGGYRVEDYFGSDGSYLGADDDGTEPLFQ